MVAWKMPTFFNVWRLLFEAGLFESKIRIRYACVHLGHCGAFLFQKDAGKW
jgi:hypothetical protein